MSVCVYGGGCSLEDPNTLKVNKNLHLVNNVLIPVFLPAEFFKEKIWVTPPQTDFSKVGARQLLIF